LIEVAETEKPYLEKPHLEKPHLEKPHLDRLDNRLDRVVFRHKKNSIELSAPEILDGPYDVEVEIHVYGPHEPYAFGDGPGASTNFKFNHDDACFEARAFFTETREHLPPFLLCGIDEIPLYITDRDVRKQFLLKHSGTHDSI
jgi:hypothetical protein